MTTILTIIFVVLLNMWLLPLSAEAQPTNNTDLDNNRTIEIFQLDSRPYGLSYADWTARW